MHLIQNRYPIVRYFTANDLAAKNPTLPKPDYLVPVAAREATLRNWYPLRPSKRLEEAKEARKGLSVIREETDVAVGE